MNLLIAAFTDNLIKSVLLIALVAIILIILVSCIKIVPQAQAFVIERLGAYSQTWGVGLHFKVPFIERISRKDSRGFVITHFPNQLVQH